MGTVLFKVLRKLNHRGEFTAFQHIGILVSKYQRPCHWFFCNILEFAVVVINYNGLLVSLMPQLERQYNYRCSVLSVFYIMHYLPPRPYL
jgi:hypothetical protein